MSFLSLAALREAGLSADWMTLYVALNPPDWNLYVPFSVSISQIQEFAIDALADCDPQDENALFRIADDTSPRHGDIDYYLPEFAKKSGVSQADALRKWRVVFLTGLLVPLSHWINGPRLPGADSLPNVMDIGGENLYEIEACVRQWDIAPEPPLIFGETRTETLECFDRLRDWLNRERSELADTEPAKIKAPTK